MDADTGAQRDQQHLQGSSGDDDAAAKKAGANRTTGASAGRRKLLLILHGKRIDDEAIRKAIVQLKAEGHQVMVRVTWDSGDVDQLVAEVVELWDTQGFHTLVSGGGDGTAVECVEALLAHKAPRHISVAQLPLGTANDLASAAGISVEPLAALRLALDRATARPVDVPLVNGRVFLNLATAGPVSEVSSKNMSGTLKKLLGPAAVAVAGLRHLFVSGLQPIRNVRLTMPTGMDSSPHNFRDDQVTRTTGDLLVLAAGQARQMARLVNLCPDALLDDGLLDFTLLFGQSLGKTAAALASDVVSQGLTHAQGGVKLLRLPWLIVEAEQDLKCNRDGEPTPASNRLVFEVLPRRLLLHLPDNRLLLEGQQEPAAAAPAAKQAGRRQLSTGGRPRPRLLTALWAAQQPPGRLSRMLPAFRRMLGKTLVYAGLLAAGFAAGYSSAAHIVVARPGSAKRASTAATAAGISAA